MGKLYWMNKILATDTGSYINFSPATNSGLTSRTVTGAINEVARQKTGIIMTRQVSPGTPSTSGAYPDVTIEFQDRINFTDNMYVDTYTSTGIMYDEISYDSTDRKISYKFKSLKESFTMRIVVQF